MSEQKLKIGITQGDTNGIGWEIILHDGAFHARRIRLAQGRGLLPKYARTDRTGAVQRRNVGPRRPPRQSEPRRMRRHGADRTGQSFGRGRARRRRGAAPRDAGAEGGAARRHRHSPLQQGERAGRRVPLHGPYRIHRGRTGRGADDDHVQRDSARGAGHQAHSGVGDQRQHHRGEDRARPAYAPPHAERGLRHRRAAHRRDGSQPACRGRRTPPTGFSQAEDTQNTTAYWPCTTIRGWRRSRRFRPTA